MARRKTEEKLEGSRAQARSVSCAVVTEFDFVWTEIKAHWRGGGCTGSKSLNQEEVLFRCCCFSSSTCCSACFTGGSR